MLLFGCSGTTPPAGNSTATNQTGVTTTGGNGGEAQACSPDFSFTNLPDVTLSDTAVLNGTATCAAGEQLSLMIDGTNLDTETPSTNGTEQVQFHFPAKNSGKHKLTVTGAGQTLYSQDWNVMPLGSSDISGLETDAVSFSEWRAVAVDVQNQINAGHVRIYLKRQAFQIQQSTQIEVDIANDLGGNPGDVLASAIKPINATSLSDNWVSFDFTHTLAPGRYWIVLKIDQSKDVSVVSDIVLMHYVTVDKNAQGNDHTRQMMLTVDENTGAASQTQWQPLPYDKEYSLTLTSD